MIKGIPTNVDDKGLLAAVKSVICEDSSSDAYVASKHHEAAHAKIREARRLLEDAHSHLECAKGQNQGDEHCRHIDDTASKLHEAMNCLDCSAEPLGKANIIANNNSK